MKLFSFLYNTSDPFSMFDSVEVVEEASELYEAKEKGVLLLHGGADISPALYGKKLSKYGHGDVIPSLRDIKEKKAIMAAVELEMPIVGICRGAQMLCAVDGGHLVQHIVGHTGHAHPILDKYSGTVIRSNSVHHQMMVPRPGNDIIASCNIPVEGYGDDDTHMQFPSVPEIVHFIQLRALGIQGHPEWAIGTPFAAYCGKLIKERLL